MSNLADKIEQLILHKLLQDQEEIIILKRNELAEELDCAPSQISYVLSTRFSYDRGFIVESRRGSGGFVRIVRKTVKPVDRTPAVMGFTTSTNEEKDREMAFAEAKKEILEDVKKFFRPEFLNRIDEILVFKPLTTDDLHRIVAILLQDLTARLQEKGVQLAWSEGADEVIVKEGTDFSYGARPLKRAIQKMVEDPIAELLLGGKLQQGNTVHGLLACSASTDIVMVHVRSES